NSERKRQAEVRIARYAGEYLDAAGHELLHQECAVRGLRVERREAAAQLREGVAKIVLGFQVCRDETTLRLVGNVVRERLQRDGIAEPARGVRRLRERRDAAFARDRHAEGRQQPLRVVFVDDIAPRRCCEKAGELWSGLFWRPAQRLSLDHV